MVLGPSISIDDWVPELPPKKKQTAAAQQPQKAGPAAKREPSPDLPLPPPPPPPTVDDERLFASDEPLPPPPPPEAIWPKPESLLNGTVAAAATAAAAAGDRYQPPQRAAKEKRLENSFSAVEDALSCTAAGRSPFPGGKSHHHHRHQPPHRGPQQQQPPDQRQLSTSEKSKSLSYVLFDGHDKTAAAAEPEPHAPKTADEIKQQQQHHHHKSEFGRSSSVRRSKLTIPNKDYCKTEFSARKSVFQAGPKQQVVMSAVKPPAFSAATSVVQNVNVVKHQICTPLRLAREAEKKAAAAKSPVKTPPPPVKPAIRSPPSAVGPIKTLGVFPPSLEPSCPPTLYQQ